MVRKSKAESKLRVLDGKDDSASNEGTRNLTSQTKTSEEEKDEKGLSAKGSTAIEVDIGLDISTAVVGICVLDAKTGKLVLLTHQKLTGFETEYSKADNFDVTWFDKSWKVRKVFIEEAAKKFSPGFSSADTIMTLGRFNGILSYKIYQLTGVVPRMVNVRSARSKLSIKIDYKDKTKNTKTKVFEAVMARNPSFLWITHTAKAGKFKGEVVYDKVNEDRADSWVICRGGQLMGA